MQIRVGQGRVAVVVVVGAVAAVEVVVVALARQFVEPLRGPAQLVGGYPDLGGEFLEAVALLDNTGFQPGLRHLPPGRHRRERHLRNRQVPGDHVAVERPDVGDQPARNVRDTRALTVDHRVREVHVGRSLVDEPLACAVDDELRRHHPFVEHELQPAVGPADGGEPPRLVEEVGGSADLLPRPDAVAHGGGIAEAPVLLEFGQMLTAPGHVVVEPTSCQDDTAPGPDPLWRAVAFDDGADDPSVDVGDQFGHRRVQPQRNALVPQRQPHPRHQRLTDGRHPVAEHPRPEPSAR